MWKNNNLLRENRYKKYTGSIDYEVCEDSYEEGELLHGKSFSGGQVIYNADIEDIFYTLSEKLGTSLAINDWEPSYSIDEEGDETPAIVLETDSTVNCVVEDKYISLPTEEELEKFRNGDINLYNCHVWLRIYDCNDGILTFEEIRNLYSGTTRVELSDEEYDEGFDESLKFPKRRR